MAAPAIRTSTWWATYFGSEGRGYLGPPLPASCARQSFVTAWRIRFQDGPGITSVGVRPGFLIAGSGRRTFHAWHSSISLLPRCWT
jgi:hypothetical protein